MIPFINATLIFSMVISLASFSYAQPIVPEITGSMITQQEAQAALDFHNKVRADVYSPPLIWSVELAAYAQEWADNLVDTGARSMLHRPPELKKGKKYGENIFWGYGGDFTPEDASRKWYNEIRNYVYEPLPDYSTGTGHYSQMVWQTTREIGIGIARYGNGGVYIVANYSPTGNIVGKKPY